MDNWFKSKWFVRLVSLAFAVILYFIIDVTLNSSANESSIPGNSTNHQTFDDIPVEIKIDEEHYVVSGVPEYVTVTLSGPAAILAPITFRRNFDVFVDLHDLEEGTHTVELQYSIASELEVFIEPKTIEVEIEERASEQYQVSVDFINTDQLPEGFELGDYELNPAEVTIMSSRTIIDQIGSVRVFVDVSGVNTSIKNREVPVNVYDSQGNQMNVRISPQTVQVSANIFNPRKEVPVTLKTVGELPEGYTLTSMTANLKEVEVFALSSVLDKISEVATEEIDLSKITETGTISVGLALPEGVKTDELDTIEVEIELEQTKTFEDIPIDIEGLGEGLIIRFINSGMEAINIMVAGNESEVKGISNEDFKAIINVNDLEQGEHVVPVTLEGPGSENLIITPEFEEVTVEIN